jgi:hypothetical protein
VFALGLEQRIKHLVVPALRAEELVIGQTYFYQLPVNQAVGAPATSFSLTGALPSGMAFDKVRGVLSGRPTVTKAAGYPLSFKAFNAAGGSPAATAALNVEVVPPTAVGTFEGSIPRSPLNANLGGRFDLTTTATGLCSGSITLGARPKLAFKNQLLLSAGKGDVILRANLPNITLADKTVFIAYVEVFAADQRAVLTLVHPSLRTTLAVTGWRNPWNITTNQATAFAASYTARLSAGSGGTISPSGYGYCGFTVSPAGTLTLKGKLPDGSGITGAAFVSQDGEIALFNVLYGTKNPGSHVGRFVISPATPVTTNAVSGESSWLKPAPLSPASTDTVYKNGFGPLVVETAGGVYVPPVKGTLVPGFTSVALGQTNADLSFALGGLDTEGKEFNQALRIANPSPLGSTNTAIPAISVTNTTKVTTFTASTGTFAGSFTLNGVTTALNRPAPFFGQLVTINGTTRGYGYFLLPTATSSISTSPKLSGTVLLQP